ncbi:alpha/beta hydrolase family esterase [Sinimarinibacterium flocculans]|uniref:alpha/beta hydrolase family esterase n=1 Tax=Sinimarinibacterium flocculans TaxID=985250 RepID=UPI003516A2AA
MIKSAHLDIAIAVSLAIAALLTACSSGEGSSAAAPPTPPLACDTEPVAMDLRAPGTAQPLASVPAEWPRSEIYALPYTYVLHVPEGLPDGPVPLLVALHGLLGSGPQFAHQSEWVRFADAQKFIVVFPTGPRKWDTTPGSFDLQFVRSVIAQQRSERCIDSRRVWATGHSYGGFMTQRLACEAGDLVAAGAVVSSGNIAMPLIGGACDAGQTVPRAAGYEPVPLAFWHGTADQVIPYEQSRLSIEAWTQRYGCTLLATEPDAPYGFVETYGACAREDIVQHERRSGTPFTLRFHTYDGHRHGYPDGCGGQGQLDQTGCEPDAGRWPTVDFHHAEILEFLQARPREHPAAE